MRIGIVERPPASIVASRYLKAMVNNNIAFEKGMLGMKAAVEAAFIPAFKEATPRSEVGSDSGKLADSTQITDFTLNGLYSTIEVGQPAENRSGNPYWAYVEDGRNGEVAPQGHALYWDELGHPVNSVKEMQPQHYIARATELGMVAMRPLLQAQIESIAGIMLAEWKAGL